MKKIFNKQIMTTLAMVVGFAFVAIAPGALNGGVAPTSSVWAGLLTWLNSMLVSDWVILLATIVLIGCVWQLAHGGGYKGLSIALGVLALAFIGPGLITTAATATGQQASIVAPVAYVSSVAQL